MFGDCSDGMDGRTGLFRASTLRIDVPEIPRALDPNSQKPYLKPKPPEAETLDPDP